MSEDVENVPEGTPVPPRCSSRRCGWGYGFALLVIGAVIGAGAMYLFEHSLVCGRNDSHGFMRTPSEMAERFAQKYSFTAVETERVAAILETRMPQMREIWSEVRPKVEALHSELEADMKAALRPEAFSAWKEAFEQRKKFFHGRGNGGGEGCKGANCPR